MTRESSIFQDLVIRYGKPERVDSALGVILTHLGLSASLPSGCVAMTHRYQSVKAFEAYKSANLIQGEIADPSKWTVTYYGPAFIGPGVYGVILITSKEIMTKQQDPEQQMPNRLTTTEFLTQLDTAIEWMIWVNPAFEEIELIVKDADEKMTAFHGPNPLSVNFQEYKDFCSQVEKMTENKER